MFEFNAERVRANVGKATTEDLLDRATVYRGGMEPEALDIIDAELRRRGVTPEQVRAHAESRAAAGVRTKDGPAAQCSFCDRPAVAEGWGWHRLWGRLPVFPRRFRWCAEHRPAAATPAAPGRPRPPG
jgi:hypothetical protein